ncbi:MAG: ribonuclease HI [Rubricoccaceae bacterium]
MKHVTLYTDGACSGNPGPGGWAALLRTGTPPDVRERVLSGAEPETTNNRMELRAVIEGLEALAEPCRVDVHSDSAYIVNAFNERWIEGWKRRGWTTAGKQPVKNRDLWERLEALTRAHHVRFVKVRGHADDADNNRVDGLAAEAMRTLMASSAA